MAEPSLSDVLKAIADLGTTVVREVGALRGDVGALRGELGALRSESGAHRAETAAHRAETSKGFSDIDKELAGHAEVHRQIEMDIETLKRRPARTAARPARRALKR